MKNLKPAKLHAKGYTHLVVENFENNDTTRLISKHKSYADANAATNDGQYSIVYILDR